MKRLIAAILAVALMPAPALAVCDQDDIAGRWTLYLDVYAIELFAAATTRCLLTINTVGAFNETTSRCFLDPDSTPIPTFGSFKLKSTGNCEYAGRLGDLTIRRLTLSADKRVLVGGGLDSFNSASIDGHGVRR